ncbi:hypothetical protein ACUW9N_000928 [Staphylococcus auricularis]|nr:hypothetical protein [Staphylococcus auricularis]
MGPWTFHSNYSAYVMFNSDKSKYIDDILMVITKKRPDDVSSDLQLKAENMSFYERMKPEWLPRIC